MLDGQRSEARARFAEEGRGFGALISPTVLISTREESKLAVSALLQQGSKRRFFVSTAGEVPYATSVETLQEITRVIKGSVE